MSLWQPSLFDAPAVPGWAYRESVLSAAEEHVLQARIAQLPFAPFEFHQWQGKRRVVSYGWRYEFDGARLSPAEPLPDFLLDLRERAAGFAGLQAESLVQTSVIEYMPGAGIGWHRDKNVFEHIIGISLAAPCTLRLRRRKDTGFERAAMALAPRSAYLLAGEVREVWEHSIAPMEQLRYAINFRDLRTP